MTYGVTFISQFRQTEVWKGPWVRWALRQVVTEWLWSESPAESWSSESLQQSCESRPEAGGQEQAYDLQHKQSVRTSDARWRWWLNSLKKIEKWKEHLCKCSGRTCQTPCCSPWKNWPLRVLAAALDRANHTAVSAPCSTPRSRSPIIWWNWGIDVETAGNRKKQPGSVVCIYRVNIYIRVTYCYWFPLQAD